MLPNLFLLSHDYIYYDRCDPRERTCDTGNMTQMYYGESSGGNGRTHFLFATTFVTAAFMTPAARLRDSAAVTARRMLGRA
jgi:hypothetical protein